MSYFELKVIWRGSVEVPRAVVGDQDVYGTKPHPDVAVSLINVGAVLKARGRYVVPIERSVVLHNVPISLTDGAKIATLIE
jgi:hypothetical protein